MVNYHKKYQQNIGLQKQLISGVIIKTKSEVVYLQTLKRLSFVIELYQFRCNC